MDKALYNEQGLPIAYIDENNIIFSYSGIPLAYIEDNSIYNYSGRYLGQLYQGWIIDLNGYPIFFSYDSSSLLAKPNISIEPIKWEKRIIPIKPFHQINMISPFIKENWSIIKDFEFFK